MNARDASMTRCMAIPLVGILSIVVPHSGIAGDCGDDLDGERVACACGDRVVASTRLRPTDPVVRERCARDGLVVEASPYAETIVLDLAGLSLVGSGVGAGIEVVRGGSEGAWITGGSVEQRGEIVGFGTGLRARSVTAVRRVENLEIKGSRHDGVSLRMAGTIIENVVAYRNGGDGFHIVGRGGRLLKAEARENAGSGIRAFTTGLIIRARAIANGVHGIVANGRCNDLGDTVVTSNHGFGLVVAGTGHRTGSVRAHDNATGEITLRAPPHYRDEAVAVVRRRGGRARQPAINREGGLDE